MFIISRIRGWLRWFNSRNILLLINTNWFNPFLTLYFNFVFFPFRQARKFPLFVYGWPKLYEQYGSMECQGLCKRGMIRFNDSIPFAPQAALANTQIGLANGSKIIFHGPCIIGMGCRILLGQKGILELGKHTKIMHCCNVTAYSRVTLGDFSRVTHRCQVIDTNFHFVANFNKCIVPNQTHPITIGTYCWICNSSTISGGAVIPNRTIVASNSLVGKDMSAIPESSIIGGVPAKLVATGFRRVENEEFNRVLWRHYISQGSQELYRLADDASPAICDSDE